KDGVVVDQIARLVEQIKANPDSRRLLVNAWNPAEIEGMALPPCHYGFQCYVAGGRLSLMWNQRSVDSFLGLPFNIASYAFLAHMLAQQCGLEAGDLIFSGGDCHVYRNHMEQVEEQLSREPYPLPRLVIHRKPGSIFGYRYEDFEIVDYRSHPAIKAPVAV
ncbi:MAG TPA: thymidylate synthase, partial [Rhodothermales bacterium]|nr:thymidylate synthase [Rhodothermales bacterium]